MQQSHSIDPIGKEVENFKIISEKYSAFMKKYNRGIGSWNQKSMDVLEKKGLLNLKNKIHLLENQLNYYQTAEKENISPEKEVQVLWRILQTEKWKFPSDLFPKLSDLDVIEIYSLDFTQIFANSAFMMNCSYDLSDLFAYSWPDLFERPEYYTRQVISQIQKAMEGSELKITPFHVSKHIGKEVFSKEKRMLEISMGLIAPLHNKQNKPVAFIATFRPRPIFN